MKFKIELDSENDVESIKINLNYKNGVTSTTTLDSSDLSSASKLTQKKKINSAFTEIY